MSPGAMLGRQRVNRPGEVEKIKRVLQQRGFAVGRKDIIDQKRFADRLFRLLDIGEFRIVDVSDYEGADLLLDLGKPIPEDQRNLFGFIYDGGTTEHIFDLPCAFRNIDQMLKPGGMFVSYVPMNGWSGHGFYQLQPALVYSYWRESLGYSVEFCLALSAEAPQDLGTVNLKDGHRRNWKLPAALADHEVCLCYGVRKPLDDTERPVETAPVMQGFYKTTWRERAAGNRKTGPDREGTGAKA